MNDVFVTCIKNGRFDMFGRPLVSGSSYTLSWSLARDLWLSGYVSVADASVFDQDPLAGTSPLDDFNVARSIAISRQPIETAANLAAELDALAAANNGNLLSTHEGIIVSDYRPNVSNVMQIIPLPAGIVDVDLTYYNNAGNAGAMMVVAEASTATEAAARMARTDGSLRIQPGETRTLKFNSLTRPANLFVKTVSALSSGANELLIRENSEILLPTNASALSSKLRAYFACLQASPDTFLAARNPTNNVAFLGTLTAAAAWANPGWITLPALASGSPTYPTIPAATFNSWFNFAAGDSFLIHLKADITPGAGQLCLIASGYSTTGGNNGFKFRVNNTGAVTAAFYPITGGTIQTVNPVADVSVGEHSCALFVDGQTKAASIYIDGLADSIGFSIAAADTFDTTRGVLIGGEFASSGATHSGPAGIYRDIQIYTWSASAPSSATVSALAARLHATVGPLLASELE